MNKEFLYGTIGVLAGALLMMAVSVYAVNNEMTGMMKMMGMNTRFDNGVGESKMLDSMNSMMHGLENTTDFDKAFLNEMITHHQGAINMAERAKTSAKREEIKDMADDIISAQSKEIEMMKQWQKDWGYTDN